MPNYETMIILKPDLEAEAEEELIANLQSTIMKRAERSTASMTGVNASWPMKLINLKKVTITCCNTPVRRRLHLNLSIFTGLTMK